MGKTGLENVHLNICVAYVFLFTCVLRFLFQFSRGCRRSCGKNIQQTSAGSLEDKRQSSVAMQNENQFTEEIIWLVQGVERCLPAWKDIIYRTITRERQLWYDWCRHVKKGETACASKTSTRRKVKAICEEQPHFWCRYFAVSCHQTHASITHGTDVGCDE